MYVISLAFKIYPKRVNVAAAPPPPKEEKSTDASKPKDTSEPADQQVDKALPAPPAPSQSDKQSGGVSQDKPKENKKEAKEETSQKEKKSDKDKESKSAAERPAVGSRGETRVCSYSTVLYIYSRTNLWLSGQDESHASSYFRASQGVAECCRIIDNIQRDRYVFTHGDAQEI